MIGTSSVNQISTEENQALHTKTTHDLQNALGDLIRASVIITDNDGNTIVPPYLEFPYKRAQQPVGRLWSCCEAKLKSHALYESAVDKYFVESCTCGHSIATFNLRVAELESFRINLIQLTDNNFVQDKLIEIAVNNGYSLSEASEACSLIKVVDTKTFVNSSKLFYHQIQLLGQLLNKSIIDNNTANEANRALTEAALIKAKNEAEESSRLKSSLLANMSHELRTPMTGILGFSEILHDELEEDRLKTMASTIYKSANRLMTTLNSIMDLSAIESNRTNLNLRPVNVKNTFMALLRNAYTIASDKGLYIRTALPPNINVIADDKLLGQLLHHLIDNAIKFTIDGGISISAYAGIRDSSNVTIKISDTGIGIAPQHHKLIFEEFRQVSEGLSRTFEGSGLGLSLVMKISKLLNAKVWVESVPEKGSDFYVSLPSAAVVNEDLTPVVEKPEPISTIRLGRGSVPEVLIVEDNEINRRLAGLYLRELCNIDMAENGYIAMNKIRSKKYDAILMDINLGAGPNGIHIANEIRTIDHYRDIPIIAVTGYTLQGDREKLLANGCSHYVAKPYDKKTLIKLFSGLLYKQEAV